MTVLTIRAHKRYAVRQTVTLRRPGEAPASGLMIDVKSESAPNFAWVMASICRTAAPATMTAPANNGAGF